MYTRIIFKLKYLLNLLKRQRRRRRRNESCPRRHALLVLLHMYISLMFVSHACIQVKWIESNISCFACSTNTPLRQTRMIISKACNCLYSI